MHKDTVLNMKHSTSVRYRHFLLNNAGGLIRNYVYATDNNTEEYEEDRYEKTVTCHSQTYRFKIEQNCGNENRCNSRYVLRKPRQHLR